MCITHCVLCIYREVEREAAEKVAEVSRELERVREHNDSLQIQLDTVKVYTYTYTYKFLHFPLHYT